MSCERIGIATVLADGIVVQYCKAWLPDAYQKCRFLYILEGLGMEIFFIFHCCIGNFKAIWYVSCPFCTFHSHFFALVCCTKKNLATLLLGILASAKRPNVFFYEKPMVSSLRNQRFSASKKPKD
jgi:hypothetical protein